MLRKTNALFRGEKNNNTLQDNTRQQLQQKVRLFKSEFIAYFFVPLFPVFIRHLDVFVLLAE